MVPTSKVAMEIKQNAFLHLLSATLITEEWRKKTFCTSLKTETDRDTCFTLGTRLRSSPHPAGFSLSSGAGT